MADRLGHDRRYGIDPTKIKDELGWYPGDHRLRWASCRPSTGTWHTADWMAHVTSGDYQKYYEQMYKNK